MKINYEKDTAGYLDITFGPKWDYIALTRPYVENFLLVNMTEKEHIHKVGTAASELLENATKFSGDDGIRMIVKKSRHKNEVQLSVYNYLDRQRAQELIEKINYMNIQDSFEFYIFRMKESVKNKQEPSKLGLARIYHEGQAKISALFHEENSIIEVRALFTV